MLNEVHKVQLDNGGLFRILQSGAIAPRTQLTNWLLFQFPVGFSSDGLEASKLEVTDNTGRKYSAESATVKRSTDPSIKSKINPDVKDEMDRLVMKAIRNPAVDLRSVRVGHVEIDQ